LRSIPNDEPENLWAFMDNYFRVAATLARFLAVSFVGGPLASRPASPEPGLVLSRDVV
jgi:hypothetical protein